MDDPTLSPDDMKALGHLVQSQFHLALAADVDGDTVNPMTQETATGTSLLAFTELDHLQAFVATAASHLTLAGRDLFAMLQGQGVQLTIDAGQPHAFELDTGLIEWLASTADQTAADREVTSAQFMPVTMVDPDFIERLGEALLQARGLADRAAVVMTDPGTVLVAFCGSQDRTHGFLVNMVNDFAKFQGDQTLDVDVSFYDPGTSFEHAIKDIALIFDLSVEIPDENRPIPGSDPDKPPKLH